MRTTLKRVFSLQAQRPASRCITVLILKTACTYIRYAEILLDYIEALSNYDPTNADIRKYWDQIRKRAGVESAFVATLK